MQLCVLVSVLLKMKAHLKSKCHVTRERENFYLPQTHSEWKSTVKCFQMVALKVKPNSPYCSQLRQQLNKTNKQTKHIPTEKLNSSLWKITTHIFYSFSHMHRQQFWFYIFHLYFVLCICVPLYTCSYGSCSKTLSGILTH